jgi:3'-5' exoribonuclease
MRLEDQVFLIAQKDLRQTTTGGLYIHAVLVDRTGQLLARMWQASQEIFDTIPDGGFLRFKGRTESYKGNLQFIIEAMSPVEMSEVNLASFLPICHRDIDDMWSQLMGQLSRIREPAVKALVDAFLADEVLMVKFRKSPAAVQLHHAYIGGLLEHTLSLVEMAALVIPRYPKVSLDLVLAGLFLHDLGKAVELGCDTKFEYTDQGQLLGHIVICTMLIEEKARVAGDAMGQPFPDQVKWAIQHIVTAHHGRYEFGSPKLPATPEAIAVHHLDNLDAKLHQFIGAIESDKDAESHWTQYNRTLETKVFKVDPMGIRGEKGGP